MIKLARNVRRGDRANEQHVVLKCPKYRVLRKEQNVG